MKNFDDKINDNLFDRVSIIQFNQMSTILNTSRSSMMKMKLKISKKNKNETSLYAENSKAAIFNQTAIMSIQKKTFTTKIVNLSALKQSITRTKKVDYK